eukprot:IDg7047t1
MVSCSDRSRSYDSKNFVEGKYSTADPLLRQSCPAIFTTLAAFSSVLSLQASVTGSPPFELSFAA